MQQINNGLWNCLAAMGFLWLLFLLILGSDDLELIIYLHTKNHNYENDNNHYRVLFICLTSCVQKTHLKTVVF
jgi:hypothetical protein